MKVIISLTSIPPRFIHLNSLINNILNQACHEVWVNIPLKYIRFPEWDGQIPDLSNLGSKLKINRDCEDVGPGTKVIGSARHLDPGDIIVYLDDDTLYDSKLVMNLLKWWKTDPSSAWGLSGFNFETYFKGQFPRHHGVPLDVLEGYGAVLVKAAWIQKLENEFKELRGEASAADDIILSNLLAKQGVKRKTVYTPESHVGHIQQLQFGFEKDALHHQFAGGHLENYTRVLQSLQDKDKNYFTYKICS